MIRLGLAARIFAVMVISIALSFLPVRGPGSWDEAYLDALLRVRDPIPVARELLLIQGPITARPQYGDAGPLELIWTLAELRADRVLLPLSWDNGTGTAASVTEALPEVSSHLDQEFTLIDENIATLFEAIRIGSIAPTEADQFVRELRRLVADSKSRIEDRLGQKAESDRGAVEDLIESFGSDRLGRELTDLGISLPRYPSAVAMPLPLRPDNGGTDFRRLSYASLGRYISLANRLETRLAALEDAGYFDETDPTVRPSVLRDHLASLRTELYEQPTEHRAAVWRDAADEYFATTAGLIDADSEARLIERLGTLTETENLDEESAANLQEMKDDLSATFAAVRREHGELMAIRNELTGAVEGSLVILEDDSASEDTRAAGAPTADARTVTDGNVDARNVDARAVVANSVLVNKHLYAPLGRDRILLLTAAGLLVGMILAPFRLLAVVLLAPIALLPGAALFPVLFLVADIWVDPLSVAAVLGGAVGVSIIAAGLAHGSLERTLTGRGVTRLPRRMLRRAVRRGGLPKNGTGRRQAAVVAVAPHAQEGGGAAEQKTLHEAISARIRHVGGIVLGEEGSMVFGAFDGPGFAQQVCAATTELASSTLPGGTPVRCGVDVGDLEFYFSPIGGYRATGPAVTYARRFCELARKHDRRVLFGASIVTACHEEGAARRFEEKGKLVVSSSDERYAFYTLTEIDPPPL